MGTGSLKNLFIQPVLAGPVNAAPSDAAEPSAIVALLEALPHMACLFDAQGQVTSCNASWSAFFGDVGAHWVEAIHPDDRHESDRIGEGEYRLRRSQGGWEWFLVSVRPYENGHEQPGLLLTAWSIDGRKRRERALTSDFTLQRKMLNATSDCIKILSTDGVLRNINNAGCLALGVTEKTGPGREWLGLLPAEVRDRGQDALLAASSGDNGRFLGKSQLEGQSPQFWDNLLTPVIDSHGDVTEIVCISRDITRQQAQEQELRLARERLELAAQVAGLGSFELCPIERVFRWDCRAATVMGQPAEGRVDYQTDFLDVLHPDDRAIVDETIRQAAQSEGRFSCEFRVPHQDGSMTYVQLRGITLFEDARPWRLIGTVQDVTEDRRIRGNLQEARDQLSVALDGEQILAREMHHRIKNIFTVTMGLISMSRRRSRGDGRTVEVLGDLSRRVIAMSRATELAMRANTPDTFRTGVDPMMLANAVLDPYAGHYRISGTGAPIPASILTPVVLLLHELSTNALKHGALSVETGVVDLDWSEQDDGTLQLVWSETGGPEIAVAPVTAGLGSGMLHSVAAMAGGTIGFDWHRRGLCATVRITPPRV